MATTQLPQEKNTTGTLKATRISVEADGKVHLPEHRAALTTVDVADVDLVIGSEDGRYFIIPNGALEATGDAPPKVVFSDMEVLGLEVLFQQVGAVDMSEAGSLRIVSENIATRPQDESESEADSSSAAIALQPVPSLVQNAPPAPLPKAAAMSAASGLSRTAANEQEQTMETLMPPSIEQPPAYRHGIRVENLADMNLGSPTISGSLFVSDAYKITYSGFSGGLPVGSSDPSASAQATRQVITGTAGNDTINHNVPGFAADGSWSKTLHLDVSGFSTLSSITLTKQNTPGLTFNIQSLAGSGLTVTQQNANTWVVAGSDAILENGADLEIVYSVASDSAAVDDIAFILQAVASGTAGLFNFEISTQFNFKYTDTDNAADFAQVTPAGDKIMVLPARGVGYDINAGAGDDVVYAGAGDDIIEGGNGNDALYGESGDDVLIGGEGGDSLDGGSGNNTASYENAGMGLTASLTTGLADIVLSGDAAGDTYANIQNLIGSAFDDILVGSMAANVLVGGSGNDVLEGIGGQDTLDGGSGLDTASYVHATHGVTANLATGKASISGGLGTDTLISIENLTGTDYADTLTGDAGANILVGGSGDDILVGGGGADTLDGGDGTDTASYQGASSYVVTSLTAGLADITARGDAAGDSFTHIENLTGSSYDDTLIGDTAANTLTGGDGDDVLEGMGGSDFLNGGSGTDTASYLHASAGVTASLTSGLSSVTAAGDAADDTYSSIENITGSAYADTLIGSSGVNILVGNEGDDTLEGLAGADVLSGGDGVDTASYTHAESGVVASLTVGLVVQKGDAAGDTYSSIENLTGSGYDDTLIGNMVANVLTGGAGDDKLEGIGGGDILRGDAGTDEASYQHAAAGVTASLQTGVATISGAASDSLIDIENLRGSAFDDILTGNAGSNIIYGGAGNDVLDGLNGGGSLFGEAGNDTLIAGSGADLLDGGTGADTVDFSTAGSGITVNLGTSGTGTATGGSGNDTLVSIENVIGTNFNDWFLASNGNNVINGGSGTDAVEYINASAGIVGSLVTGIVTGGSGTDTLIGIEQLVGTNFADTLTGNDSDNMLAGKKGNDTLIGMGGNDTLYGDEGNDILRGGEGDDTLWGQGDADVLDGGNGNDTAWYGGNITVSLTTTFAVGPAVFNSGEAIGDTFISIENLATLSGGNWLIGDSGNNILSNFSGGGWDTFEGMDGADTFYGNGGNDTASYEHATAIAPTTVSGALAANGANYVVTGVAATFTTLPGITQLGHAAGDVFNSMEYFKGSIYNDLLIGDGNANVINGNGGADLLEGLGGGDTFIGSGGNVAVTYQHSGAGVVASLASGGSGVGTDSFGDTYSGINHLIGSNFADTLEGDDNANTLNGLLGNDTIRAFAGNDTIYATQGSDSIDAGSGDDTIYASVSSLFSALEGGAGNDTLSLGNLGASYSLSTLSGLVNNIEVISLRGDGVSTALTVGSSDIQSMVDQGNNSHLTLRADSGDTLVISDDAAHVASQAVTGGTDYFVYNDAGHTTLLATVHWQVAA